MHTESSRREPDRRGNARRSIAPLLSHLQREVLGLITARGPRGATDDEIAVALDLQLDTARARRCELRDAGAVVDSGLRRKTRTGRLATVWVAASVPREATPAAPSRPAAVTPNALEAAESYPCASAFWGRR
jgi:hypothetical protein